MARMSRHAAIVPPASVTYYVKADGRVPEVEAGDLLLVRHHGFVASGIRGACRLRCPRGVSRADWAEFCAVNHAATAVSSKRIAQEEARGMVLTPVEEFDYVALAVVRMHAAPVQLHAAAAYAKSCVGDGYGFLQIPADFLNALTGLELSFGFGNRMVCSTAACLSAERTDFIPDRAAGCVTPPHLAWYFGAKVPRV